MKHYLNGYSYPSEKHFLTQFTYFSELYWRPCPGTKWRDWFESPHTKVITGHKINPGLFVLIRSRSGTEMLNPRGTSYIFGKRCFKCDDRHPQDDIPDRIEKCLWWLGALIWFGLNSQLWVLLKTAKGWLIHFSWKYSWTHSHCPIDFIPQLFNLLRAYDDNNTDEVNNFNIFEIECYHFW
jgi:hypothetical protein